jgi:hypothetical protein
MARGGNPAGGQMWKAFVCAGAAAELPPRSSSTSIAATSLLEPQYVSLPKLNSLG